MAAQYRLADEKTITPIEAMADARAAIRWVRVHARELGSIPVALRPTAGPPAAISRLPRPPPAIRRKKTP